MADHRDEESTDFTGDGASKYHSLNTNDKMGSTKMRKRFACFTSSFCAAGLAVTCTIIITVLVLMNIGASDNSQVIASLESELLKLEHQLKTCEPGLNSELQGSADGFLDDEDLELRSLLPKANYIETLVGKWQQVRTENMEAYNKADGANAFVTKMSNRVNPFMEIRKDGESSYVQVMRAFMHGIQIHESEWPIDLSGKLMHFKNYEKEETMAVAIDNGDKITITNIGGSKGPLISTFELIGPELHFSSILTEKGYVKVTRIFKRV